MKEGNVIEFPEKNKNLAPLNIIEHKLHLRNEKISRICNDKKLTCHARILICCFIKHFTLGGNSEIKDDVLMKHLRCGQKVFHKIINELVRHGFIKLGENSRTFCHKASFKQHDPFKDIYHFNGSFDGTEFKEKKIIAINDKRLSPNAKKLMIFLCHSEVLQFYGPYIKEEYKETKENILNGIIELTKSGYYSKYVEEEPEDYM